MIVSGILTILGLVELSTLVWNYLMQGFILTQISHNAILGLFFVIIGFQTFAFTLLLEMAKRVTK
jgi:hypothetical protein